MQNFINEINKKTDEMRSLLKNKKNILILCHQYPDGDAVGSSHALGLALLSLNKNIKILCCDEFSRKYDYITSKLSNSTFENPDFIICVDVADTRLLGEPMLCYVDKIDLSIDHHRSRLNYAGFNIINPKAAAACEIIYRIIVRMGINITKEIADCLYTGITTDTGCFRYSNVTENTHKTAADLIRYGADTAKINKVMFETKSLSRIRLEQEVISTLKLFINNKCAVVVLTNFMIEKVNAEESDTDGISSIPGKLEGVLVGVTLREKDNGKFKVSVRTQDEINASSICTVFGGGGHKNAAGCEIGGNVDVITEKLVSAVSEFLNSEQSKCKKKAVTV